MTVEAAQQAAAEVAKGFGNFECDRCARKIAEKLEKGFNAAFVRLVTSDDSDAIGLVKEGIQISANRVHVGVKIGDKIFDNLHGEGVEAAKWQESFVAATEAPLLQQSRSIKDFWGKTFQPKKFYRWLFGS